MATYRVQLNDTPASIARRFTGSMDATLLIAANPQKPRVTGIDGGQTFKTLSVGELLALPPAWRVRSLNGLRGVGAFGTFALGDPASDGTANAVVELGGTPALCQSGNATVLAFQNSYNAGSPATPLTPDGDYGPATMAALQSATSSVAVPAACTSYTGAQSYTLADLVTAANTVIADTTICTGTNANVLNFQKIYNQVQNASLSLDGEYGPASATAMASLASSSTLAGSPPAACANFTPTAGGGSPTAGSAGSGVTTITNTQAAPASSTAPWVIGAIALIGGVGAFYMLSHKPKGVALKHGKHVIHHRALHARRR